MEYEGSIHLVSRKCEKWFSVEENENFLLLIFTFEDFIWLKNMIWTIKKNVCHAPLWDGICVTPTASPLKARKLKIFAPEVL
jgi:hypothetical protein